MEKNGFATSESAWLLWRLAPTLTVVHSASPAWRRTSSFRWLIKFFLPLNMQKQSLGVAHVAREMHLLFLLSVVNTYKYYFLLVNNVARKCHLSVEQSEERHRGMREHFPSGTKHSKVLRKYLRLCTKYLNPLLTEAPLTEDFMVIWVILNHNWQRFRQCCSL